VDLLGAEDPLPAQRVDDQGRAHVAAVGMDHVTVAPLHLRDLELGAGPALRPEQRAEHAVVERRERPAERPARARTRRVADEAPNVCRIDGSSPRLRSHSVGAAQAEVWRSPIS
jgi:hypothetical protein